MSLVVLFAPDGDDLEVVIDAIVLANAKLGAGHNGMPVGPNPGFSRTGPTFRVIECQFASIASNDKSPCFGLARPKSANSATCTMLGAVLSNNVPGIVEGHVEMVAMIPVPQWMAGFAC